MSEWFLVPSRGRGCDTLILRSLGTLTWNCCSRIPIPVVWCTHEPDARSLARGQRGHPESAPWGPGEEEEQIVCIVLVFVVLFLALGYHMFCVLTCSYD